MKAQKLLLVILVTIVTIQNRVIAQKFGFGGTARASLESSDRRDTLSQRPATLWRIEAEPTIFLYGVPFSALFLISSEQTDIRQNINLASFNLSFGTQKLRELLGSRISNQISKLEDLNELKDRIGIDMLRDSLSRYAPEQLKDLDGLESKLTQLKELTEAKIPEDIDKLKNTGLLFGAESIFLNFPSFGIGNITPNFSEYILSGLTMNGAMAEFNPGGLLYLAGAFGKSQKAVNQFGVIIDPLTTDSVNVTPTYYRGLYSARAGFGRNDGTHIFLTGLYANDDITSLNDSISKQVAPQSNYVLGLEGKISFLEDKLTILGQVNGSSITEDERASSTEGLIPDQLNSIVSPKTSTHLDLTFLGKAMLNLPKSDFNVSLSTQYVGPGYLSLGTPFLRTDYLKYEAIAEQKFLSRQISVGGFYRTESDNLANLKSSTTVSNGFGLKLGLNFKGLPFISMNYSPISQESSYRTDSVFTLKSTTTSLGIQASYSYPIDKNSSIYGSTTAAFNKQSQENNFENSIGFDNSVLFLNQTLSFAFPLTLSFGVSVNSLAQTGLVDIKSDILDVNLGATYTAFQIWDNGINFYRQSTNSIDSKLGVGLSSSYRVFQNKDGSKYGIIELRGEKYL